MNTTKLHRKHIYKTVGFPSLVTVILLAAYGLTLAPGITWANYGVDSGDFATAAALLGIPHPPGYPTYTILTHLFQRLPLGEPAYATNWFSALCTAIAGGLLARLVTGALEAPERFRVVLGGLTGLALGLAPLVWSQAVITEVHGLNLLFVVLALWLARNLSDREYQIGFGSYMLALMIGLSLGNHVTIALLLVGIGVLAIRRGWSEPQDRRKLVWLGVALLLGSLVYLYLPLRARANPILNWGDHKTWDRFLWTISADPYQGLAFSLPSGQIPRRIAAWATLMREAFGYLGLVLGVVGLMYGRSKVRALDMLAMWMILVYSAFAIGYSTADSLAYLIPAQMGFLWLIVLGLQCVYEWIGQRLPGHTTRVQVGLLAIFLVSTLFGAWMDVEAVDASHDQRAIDYARNAMQQAPEGAVIMTWQALDAFPLWYVHLALGERPDLAVIVVPLLQYDWYHDQLSLLYPDLEIPDLSILTLDDPTAPTPPEFWGRPVCFPEIQPGEEPVLELICEDV